MIQDLSFIERQARLGGLLPFWPKGVTNADQKDRLNIFYAKIYTTWASIVSKHITREFEDSRHDKTKDFDDLTVLHLCDINIYDSGNRPDRITSGNPGNQEKKEKVVNQARDVYAD